jgi:hypothetical protein
MNKISPGKLWFAVGAVVFCVGIAGLASPAYAGPVGAPIINTSTLTVNLVNDPTGPATSADFNLSVTDVSATTNVGASDSQSFVMDENDPYTVTEATTTNSANYMVALDSGCSGTLSADTTCTITNTFVAPVVIPTSTPTSTLTVNVTGLMGSDTAMIAVTDTTTSTLSVSTTTGNAAMPIVLNTNDAYSVDATTTASNYTIDLSACPSGMLATDTTCSIAFAFVPPAPVVPPVTPSSSNSNSNNSGVTFLVGQGNEGGSGGGSAYIPPTSTSTTSDSTTTSTNSDGTVLGTSTITDPAALILTLEQQVIALQLKEANCSFIFNQNLYSGMTNGDVKNLQQALNMSELTQVAAMGPGSPGNESMYFGRATKNAVINFQNIFSSQILTPAGLTTASGFVGPSTRSVLNELCSQ